MVREKVQDLEKVVASNGSDCEYIGDEGAVHAETFVIGDSWYAKTQRLFTKFGVEARGIERVPSDERTNDPMSNIGTLVSLQNISEYIYIYIYWKKNCS